MDVLSLLFPKFCVQCRRRGEYLCTKCFAFIDFLPTLICAVCSKPAIDGITHPGCRTRYTIDGVFASVAYKGSIKKLLYQYKFSPYLSQLTPFLSELMYEGVIQFEPIIKIIEKNTALVPIPLTKKKARQRGYNQAELLAQELGKKLQLPIEKCLIRRSETKPQSELSREERRENIKNAFSVAAVPSQSTIFLVDDIVTSGATFNEAAKVLKKNGAKIVWGVALAHGQ